MQTTTLGALVLTAALATTGCGSHQSNSADNPTKHPTATHTPKVKPTRDPYAPNTGKYALRLGQPRHGSEITSTLLAVKRPMMSTAEPYLQPDEPSQEFMGAEVRTCVKKSSKDNDQVVWADWVARARNGNIFPGWDSSWQQWPTPQYPSYKVLSPGQCISGWLLIPVPKGTPIVTIEFAPAGGPTAAEWRLRAARH